MSEPQYMRGACASRIGARFLAWPVAQLWGGSAGEGSEAAGCLTGHDFDPVAAGIRQPDAGAAAGRGQRLDRRVRQFRQPFEVGQGLRPQTQPRKAGFAFFGGVKERRRSRAAGIEHTVRTLLRHKSEIAQKARHDAEIRRPKAHMGNIFNPDDGHRTPSLYLTIWSSNSRLHAVVKIGFGMVSPAQKTVTSPQEPRRQRTHAALLAADWTSLAPVRSRPSPSTRSSRWPVSPREVSSIISRTRPPSPPRSPMPSASASKNR